MRHRPHILIIALSVFLWIMLAEHAGPALAIDNEVFPKFTGHIARQVGIDKQAFAQASTCLSWFYHTLKQAPPAAAQGVSFRLAVISEPARDCPKHYPGGMDMARDDFARKQAFLSVSLTVYEFALVADHNDDQHYNAGELEDLFHSLSIAYDAAAPPPAAGAALTARFDQWYRAKSLEEVMHGMSSLYERGYRVTAHDRAELDRVMR